MGNNIRLATVSLGYIIKESLRMGPAMTNQKEAVAPAAEEVEELERRLAEVEPVEPGRDCYADDAFQVARDAIALLKARVAATERMAQAFPTLSAFYEKHALGSKARPSCFKCGRADRATKAIAHMELPDVFLCERCVAPAAEPVAESPMMKCTGDEDCPYCSGESCARCVRNFHRCECDSFDRHKTAWEDGEQPIPAAPPAADVRGMHGRRCCANTSGCAEWPTKSLPGAAASTAMASPKSSSPTPPSHLFP